MTTDRHMQVAGELLAAAQKRADDAEARAAVLAAEVKAWREYMSTLEVTWPRDPSRRTAWDAIAKAREQTEKLGGLA